MSISVRLHFDGKTFVPDEPVNVPVDQPFRAELEPILAEDESRAKSEGRAALEEIIASGIRGVSIPDEALRRENLYEDRR